MTSTALEKTREEITTATILKRKAGKEAPLEQLHEAEVGIRDEEEMLEEEKFEEWTHKPKVNVKISIFSISLSY